MANSLNQNPLVLDTAAATAVLSGPLNVTKIRWVDYNNDIADGDQAVVQDAAGVAVWEARCTTVGAGTTTPPGGESDFAPGFRVKGLLVPTLTHGKLYIYLDQSRTSVPVAS